jgi:hypothetical protein
MASSAPRVIARDGAVAGGNGTVVGVADADVCLSGRSVSAWRP